MPLPIIPTTALNGVRRTPVTSSAAVGSPFSGKQQVYAWGGEWWEYDLEFWPQYGADGRALSGFLTALGGLTGTFIFKDPAEKNTASVGTPVVAGASQTGSSLNTSGWTPSITVLTAGQFIQLGTDTTTRLHQVTADATSDGGGLATLAIWPALRESPADLASITIDEPGVILRLQESPPTFIAPTTSYRFSLSAREVI